MRLANKVALVIGASRGMGKRAALELAGEGADVVVAARTDRAGQSAVSGTITETADEIRKLGRKALAVRVDLANGEEIDAMYRRAMDAFGRIDLLVHSVQYMGPGYLSPFLDTSVAQLEAQLKVNLLSAVHATRLVAPQMVKRGGGRIVLVSSAAATVENPNQPGDSSTGLGYPMTKAGLNRFVWAVEKELRPHKVAVVAVDPGFTFSEHVREGAEDGLYHGWPIEWAHSVEVPAGTIRELCAMDDVMAHSGTVVVAEQFAKAHGIGGTNAQFDQGEIGKRWQAEAAAAHNA
jgi:NAD(P)-dependent dehydrogenase (short-subunit alcohol dehydrogenase family)